MGYRLEITRNKKEKLEKVDIASIEDLMGIAHELVEQLNLIHQEVSTRDTEFDDLKKLTVEQASVIDDAINKNEKQEEKITKYEELVKYREHNIKMQQEVICEKNNEIQELNEEIARLKRIIDRLGDEAQEKYTQIRDLKDKLEEEKEKNEMMQKKLNDINKLLR